MVILIGSNTTATTKRSRTMINSPTGSGKPREGNKHIDPSNGQLEKIALVIESVTILNDTTTTTTTIPTTTKPTTIPSDFIKLGEHYYYFSQQQYLSWSDALTTCKGRGGNLAYPMNSVEMAHIETYMKQNKLMNVWLGGSYVSNPGAWQWSHDLSTITYFDWIPGFPSGNLAMNNCLLISTGDWQKYKWMNYPCKNIMLFICQI